MPRPLMQHGVGQLEEMFAKGKADAKVLKQLEHELQYRQVPRAVALLAEVQAAMNGGAVLHKRQLCRRLRRRERQHLFRSSPTCGGALLHRLLSPRPRGSHGYSRGQTAGAPACDQAHQRRPRLCPWRRPTRS